MTSNLYERQYQRLKQHGEPAWAGEGYERAWRQLTAMFQTLRHEGALPTPGATCLELGCGNGAMVSLLLARAGYRVSGVDISPTAIAWAQELFAAEGLTGNFQVGDVCTLEGSAPRQFDLVYDGSCLHCLIDGQRARCFHQVQRVLKPGGNFIVSSMCDAPKSPTPGLHYDAERHQLLKAGQPWRTLLPLPLLQAELRDRGFEIFRCDVNENPWWNHATLCCRVR